ncbi:MAG: hypothetical protein KKB03_03745 [Nanoarchaeota archaeon]|nr:hypothetical protein [Nanoarchaeota archaeon]MBU1135041.1 hypothetical protein [Nanoarchaeota archaeon]MBU2520327.1 hypothetical protein [Nanoarchaeota archaeon]
MNKFDRIVSFLEENYYSSHFENRDPFRTLISCFLSQCARDENMVRASAALFREAADPHSMLKLSQSKLEQLIPPTKCEKCELNRICKYLKQVI